MKIEELKNLGPKSREQLAQININTRDDLEVIGAVSAYWQLKAIYPKLSLNMLYAMEGALLNVHCIDLSNEHKANLLAQLDAIVQADKHLQR